MTGYLAVILALAPAYLIRFHILGIPTTLLEVLIVGFLFITLLSIEQKDLKKIKKLGRINTAIALFVLAAVIATAISPDKLSALGQLKAYVLEPILVFYALILLVKSQQQLKTIFQAIFLASVIISILGIIQHYTFIRLPLRFWGQGNEVARIVSVFEYPNALSLYLGPLLGLFATLWIYDFPLTKNKFVAALGLVLMGIALVFTFSRGAWIAAIIAILGLMIKRFGIKKVALPAILAAFLLFLVPSVQQRLMLGVSDASSSAHWDLMEGAMQKIASNPILGNGLLGFNNQSVLYPHNFIFNFWLELGILGLIAFLWILYLAFRQHQKQPSVITLAALIYLSIMLIHGMVDVPYFKNDLSLLFWFILSLFYLPKD